MSAEERQKRLAEYLQKVEFATLEELASQVDASVSTVRRDLTELEFSGSIRRTHGGARLVNNQSDEFAFSRRDILQQVEKETIGRACAKLIQPSQSVIIDSGTTAYHAARHIDPNSLHVITNSLPVANLFASTQKIEVTVSGGVIYPQLGVLVGPLAVETFSKLNADVAIMSGGGITLDGVTNSHTLLINIQQAMIAAASKVIFCLDHTKLGRRSVAQLCDLSSVDVIVTDAGAPPDLVKAFRARGLEVIVTEKVEIPKAVAIVPERKLSESVKKSPRPALAKAQMESQTESSDNRMGWD